MSIPRYRHFAKTAILATVLVAIIDCENRFDAGVGNPIATCGPVLPTREETSRDCVTMKLHQIQVTRTSDAGSISGTVIVNNRCESPMALIAAPISTRATA